MRDLCTIGHLAIDVVITVPKFAKPDGLTVYANSLVREYGGLAANIAVISNKLGTSAGIFGCLGNDLYAKLYIRYLNSQNIDTSHIQVVDGNTAKCIVIANEKIRQREMFFYESCPAPLTNVDKKWINSFKTIYLCPRFPYTILDILERYNGEIVYDPSTTIRSITAKNLKKILSKTDILFARDMELKVMKKLLRMNKQEIVDSHKIKIFINTHGTKGATVYHDNEKHFVPPVGGIRGIHVCGVGEGFRSGFVTAHQKGYCPEDCAKIGAIVSSFVLKEIGGQTNVPTWSQVMEKLEHLNKSNFI